MNFFEVLAECSIAFVGFGAVHAVLQGSRGPRGIFRAWTVVLHGAVAFVMSIIPLLLDLTNLSVDQLWRGASVAGFSLSAFTVYVIGAIDFRMTRMGHPPQARIIFRIAQVLTGIATLAVFSNSAGWLTVPGPQLYALATVLILFTGLLAMLHSFLVPLQMFFDSKSSETNES